MRPINPDKTTIMCLPSGSCIYQVGFDTQLSGGGKKRRISALTSLPLHMIILGGAVSSWRCRYFLQFAIPAGDDPELFEVRGNGVFVIEMRDELSRRLRGLL